MDAQLAAESQQYAADGTAASNIAITRQGIAAEAAAAEERRNEALFKRQIEIGEYEIKARNQAESERSNRAQESIARGRLRLDQDRQRAEVAGMAGRGVIAFDANGNRVQDAQAAGQPFQSWSTGDKAADQKLAGQYAAYYKLDSLYAELEDHIRTEPSGKLDMVNLGRWKSDKKKRTEQLQSQISVAIGVANGLGALAEADLELANKISGGVMGAGGESYGLIRSAREDAHRSMQSEFSGYGYGAQIPKARSLLESEAAESERARVAAEDERRRQEKYGKGGPDERRARAEEAEYSRRREGRGAAQRTGAASAPDLTAAPPPTPAAPPGLPPSAITPPLLPPPEPPDYSRYIHQQEPRRGR